MSRSCLLGLAAASLAACLPLRAAEVELFVPAAASAEGRFGTRWTTELRLFNPGSEPRAVRLAFLPPGRDNSAAGEVAVTVPARRSLVLADVVGTVLGETGGGGLRLRADGAVVATTRTENLAGCAGSVGLAVPAVERAAAVTRGLLPHLTNLPGPAGQRTNVGFLNPSTTSSSVTYTLRDAATGEALGSATLSLAAHGFSQVNDVFEALGRGGEAVASAVLEVEATSPVLGFGTLVVNSSGDGSYVLASPDLQPAASESWRPWLTVPPSRGLAFRVEDGLRITGNGGPPRVLILPDGRVRLFYNGPGGLRSATSSDGLTFTDDPGIRIPNGDPAVIYLENGGYRFLTSTGPPGSQTLRSAVSTDGLTFTQEPGERYRPTAEDAGYVQVPHTVKLPDGRWRLYYVADWFGAGGSANPNNTRTAISTDEGLTFTPERGSETTGRDTVDPEVSYLEGGGFRLYYKRGDGIYAIDSPDGVTFPSFATSTRVLDARDRVDPAVVRFPDGTLRIYFGTISGMGSAVATD